MGIDSSNNQLFFSQSPGIYKAVRAQKGPLDFDCI